MTSSVDLMKVVVLGSGGTGKSCLTLIYLANHFVESYDPTIEDVYRKQVVIDERPVLLDILDTAGQEEYSAMRHQYMREGEGFLIAYAINDRASFEEISELHEQILRNKDKNVGGVPIVLAATKSDLEVQRVISTQEGKDLATRIHVPFFETSALLRHNIDESFAQLIREIRKSRPNPAEPIGPNTPKKLKKKSACTIV